jgi:hypothetical protein
MWFEMTLNYQRIVERYPKPNEVVDDLNHGPEIFSPLDKKKLAKGPHATYVPKRTKNQRLGNI